MIRCYHIAVFAPPLVVAEQRLYLAECGRRRPGERMVPMLHEPRVKPGRVCPTCRAMRARAREAAAVGEARKAIAEAIDALEE